MSVQGDHSQMRISWLNLIEFSGCSLPAAVKTASLNPARLLGMQEQKGSLEEGKDADIVIFDKGFNIRYTVIGGKVFYARDACGRFEQQ